MKEEDYSIRSSDILLFPEMDTYEYLVKRKIVQPLTEIKVMARYGWKIVGSYEEGSYYKPNGDHVPQYTMILRRYKLAD